MSYILTNKHSILSTHHSSASGQLSAEGIGNFFMVESHKHRANSQRTTRQKHLSESASDSTSGHSRHSRMHSGHSNKSHRSTSPVQESEGNQSSIFNHLVPFLRETMVHHGDKTHDIFEIFEEYRQN